MLKWSKFSVRGGMLKIPRTMQNLLMNPKQPEKSILFIFVSSIINRGVVSIHIPTNENNNASGLRELSIG